MTLVMGRKLIFQRGLLLPMARMPKNNGDLIPLIHATVTIRGEPDTQPLTRVYYFDDGTDGQIFFNSIAIIKEKISNGMRININEVLLMYLGQESMRYNK